MSVVFLNGDYLPQEQARISPMDRGFLFGDGIYEVIPSSDGRMVGFSHHIERMNRGLRAIHIERPHSAQAWRQICAGLLERNGGGALALYLHVSRGCNDERSHAWPRQLAPTVFAFAFATPAGPADSVPTYTASTARDLRWKRCDLKSTALLGNIMHFNQAYRDGNSEAILYNEQEEITEASSCNVYVVKNGAIATPPDDRQILPGITRLLLLDILRAEGSPPIAERVVSLAELRGADEVWLSSSTRDIAPVLRVDGAPVGNGAVGAVWRQAQALFARHKHDF